MRTVRLRFDWLTVAALLLMLAPELTYAGSLFGGDRLSKFTNNRAFRWQTNSTEHCTIYYEAGSATEPRLKEIVASVEASRTSVLGLIQQKEFPDQIHVFLVDSKSR